MTETGPALLPTAASYEPESSENAPNVSDVTVLMPIGGRATRAIEVTRDEIPKHLIPLGNGQTVLETICSQLQHVGFQKFVFCLGYHAEQNKSVLSAERWVQTEKTTYQFSEETEPLGVDGAILKAIHDLGLVGQGMFMPGDVMARWKGLAIMNRDHSTSGADITMGVTSTQTERTTDVGKFIVEDTTNRLLWLYGRNDTIQGSMPGIRTLTSVGANTISMHRFSELCNEFLKAHPSHEGGIGLRDQIIPWAVHIGEFAIHAYDVGGEILDLGTPSNIRYGQANWQIYAS